MVVVARTQLHCAAFQRDQAVPFPACRARSALLPPQRCRLNTSLASVAVRKQREQVASAWRLKAIPADESQEQPPTSSTSSSDAAAPAPASAKVEPSANSGSQAPGSIESSSSPPRQQLVVNGNTMVGYSVGSYALMAIAAFGLCEVNGISLVPQYALSEWASSPGPTLAFLAVFLAALLAAVKYQDRVPALQEIDRVLKQGMLPLLLGLPWWGVMLLAFGAGYGEEAMFRGFVQSAAVSKAAAWGGLSGGAASATGLVFASVVFGALHAVTPLYFWWATAAGLVFGLEYANYGLPAASATHFLYDWIALYLAVDEGRGGPTDAALRKLVGAPPPPAATASVAGEER